MRHRPFQLSPGVLLLLTAALACEFDDDEPLDVDVEAEGESLAELAQGEGPWVGGMFDHRMPPRADPGEDKAGSKVELGEPLVQSDASGGTNEVIVLLARDTDALTRALPPLAGRWPEDKLVAAVHDGESRTLAEFGHPIGARYLLPQRPDSAYHQELAPDSPEGRLQRYVVLTFETVEQARRAAASLAGMRGVEFAGHDQMFELSAAPDDPYLPIKPITSQYQWGMHAMNFLSAWGLTPGSAWLGVADGGVVDHADLTNVRPQLSFMTGAVDAVYAIHGSHVSGILAATQGNSVGVTGACPSCSLVIAGSPSTIVGMGAAIAGLVDRGVQVINMSFGLNGATCATMQPICDALTVAQSRDVLLVAAAGNYKKTTPDFPASQPGVLAVGGVQNTTPGQPMAWTIWGYDGSNGSNAAGLDGVVGPARSVVSTTPVAAAYNSSPWVMCGDKVGFDQSGTYGDGYGSCTGTSMAAPHIAALGGMVRSVNPRLSATDVKTIIRQSGSHVAVRSALAGYGLPSALKSVQQAIAKTPNRLTPLFAFYSAGRLDHFYTAVPQMGSAAIVGRLQPGVGANPSGYTTLGVSVIGYAGFPGIAPSASRVPRAQVWIFTTPANPKSVNVPLAPLYRLSWKCGDPGVSPVCAQNPGHTDFVYTADKEGVTMYTSWGYRLDGIEGYIYPKTIAKPAGTVRLMRKYNAARDDHAIFPETELAGMAAQGYTSNSGSDWLGYVYPNGGNTPNL